MFKKTFLVSTAAILISFLASCSLVNSPDNSGSVTLTLSRSAARNADSDLETLYVDVSLKGDYSQTQTISLTSESQKATVTFDQIRPNASIYIEANAYLKEPGLNEKYILYKGVSNSIKVKPGENNISLSLKKLYTVWFELNGGTGDFDEQRVVSGEKATKPETEPTKEATDDYAYEFIGWYTSDDALFNFDTPITQDTILYAKWAQKSFVTVTFDSNNGKDEEPFATVRVVEGKTVKQPENHPEKEGTDEFAYEFSGWYTSTDNGETISDEPFDFDTPITGNLTLYAFWNSTEKFTVSFNVNGGTGNFESQIVTNGDKATEPTTQPTKEGDENTKYTFTGWYTSSDEGETLSETPFNFTKTKITKSITLYAKWNVQVTSSIDVEIPYENVTKEMLITSMRGQEGGTWEITAKEGYDSYTWKWDGVTQSEYNNKNVFITPTAIKGGTYTVSLLVTKIIDGETKYYSETTQVTREQ